MKTVGELIAELQKFDPALPVCFYEDGNVTRKGDYYIGACLAPISIREVSYGGYEDDVNRDLDYWVGEKFDAVFIGPES